MEERSGSPEGCGGLYEARRAMGKAERCRAPAGLRKAGLRAPAEVPKLVLKESEGDSKNKEPRQLARSPRAVHKDAVRKALAAPRCIATDRWLNTPPVMSR